MLKNYFKIAWRNLLKDSQATFLNLIGLATGLAYVLLIFLWVNDELHNKSLGGNNYGGRFPISVFLRTLLRNILILFSIMIFFFEKEKSGMLNRKWSHL